MFIQNWPKLKKGYSYHQLQDNSLYLQQMALCYLSSQLIF